MLQVPGPTIRIVWPRGEHIEATSSGGNFIERILHRVLFGGEWWLLKLEFPTAPRLPCRSDNHARGSIRANPTSRRREGRNYSGPLYGQRTCLPRGREGKRKGKLCLMLDTRRRAQDLGWIEMSVAPAKGQNAVYRWGAALQIERLNQRGSGKWSPISRPNHLMTTSQRRTSKPPPKPELKAPRHSFEASNCMTSAESATTRAPNTSPAPTRRRNRSAGLSGRGIVIVFIFGAQGRIGCPVYAGGCTRRRAPK
jgi:hypothetical protein